MAKDTLTITDNRTGKTYEVPINEGTIRALDLRQIVSADKDDFGLMTYDPAFMNTASCRSKFPGLTPKDNARSTAIWRSGWVPAQGRAASASSGFPPDSRTIFVQRQ